ncbi:MAG: DUF805 domain-containing protein [Candidatus Riflebacteria bacterium]|nr:DUF805 domain-containing protein [Candidatus Riflebacteria bacterium]MBR4569765.1 DUF805 domain-containing protein [Candidatus Riflebacteria bacterium]
MNSIADNFVEIIKSCFCFEGKLNREKFWTYVIILFIPFYLFMMPLFLAGVTFLVHFPRTNIWTNSTTYSTIGIWTTYFFLYLVYFILTLGPSARRLRDAGFTPWLLFLHLLLKPIGPIALIVLFCLPTNTITKVKKDETAEANTLQPEEVKKEEETPQPESVTNEPTNNTENQG